jgi:hypothetical protein
VRLAVDVHKRPNGTHESLTPETHNVGASAARVTKHCIKPRFAPGDPLRPGPMVATPNNRRESVAAGG